MMNWHKWASTLTASSMLFMQVQAEPPAAKRVPPPGEVEHLVRQLSSNDFQQREAASKRLDAIGYPALDALRRTASNEGDLEARRRAERLIGRIENGLDALLAAYRAHGLPLPPPHARLVRYKDGGGAIINGKVEPVTYAVAFEVAPATKSEGPCLLTGTYQWRPPWRPKTREVAPGPDILGELAGADDLAWAVQFHARGWDDLANALLERCRKEGEGSLQMQLLHTAWIYWLCQITEPGIDRTPVARHLRDLVRRNKEWDTQENRDLLRGLELALTPSKAKPGSVEALIDDLVNHTNENEYQGIFQPQDRYWRTAALGFDAVPALIEHLDDDRLTRAILHGFNNFRSRHLYVGDLSGDLLEGLAGHRLGREWIERQGGARVSKTAAKKWWEEARKVGEEAYLLDNVLPTSDRRGDINEHMLKVLVVKYPHRLPSLYRKVLDEHPGLAPWTLAEAVRRCSVPQREKLAVFARAARHKRTKQRLAALMALAKLNKEEYNAQLLFAVESLPEDIPGQYWMCLEAEIAALVDQADDPKVWRALERAAKRAAVGLRMEMLYQLCRYGEDRNRRQRLFLLARFLDDATVRDTHASKTAKKFEGLCAASAYPQIEVRSFAALEMAEMLGINVPLETGRTPVLWTWVRDKVREAWNREQDKGEMKSERK